MALTLANNVSSLVAQNNLNKTSSSLNTSLERLSSGLKINRGADGPAALVASEEQRAQITGLNTAIDNTNKAVSLVQTGEGALNQVSSLLDQVRGLALDSANSGVNDATTLQANQDQITNALNTITSIATNTTFGQTKLLDGSAGINATTSDAGVHFISADSSAAGTGNFTVKATGITVAQRATLTGGAYAAPTADESFTINGAVVNLSKGDTETSALSKINSVSSQSGVFAQDNGGKIELVTNQFGSAATISIGNISTGSVVGTSLNGGTAAAGVDVAATIGTTTVTGKGNELTYGGVKLSFDADQTDATHTKSLTPAADVAVNVTNGSLVFQIGSNANQTATIGFQDSRSTALGKGVTTVSGFASLNDINVTSQQKAQDSIKVIDQAISDISSFRGKLGSFQTNTLQATASNLQTQLDNTTAAESTIRDTNYAQETANQTKYQVQLQAGISALSSANQNSQLVLKLLG